MPVPGRLYNPLLFGAPGADGNSGLGVAAAAHNQLNADQQPATTAGELITGTYATYHGPIDLMVPTLAQDHDKSLDSSHVGGDHLNITKAKFFRSQSEPKKTVLAFLAQKNMKNISFVINQDDLVENVLQIHVMEDLGFKKENGVDLS